MADQNKPPKSTVKNKKGSATKSTQLFLDIAEIKDNIVVLKNGGLRAVLQTNSINFNLKSEQEQNSIIFSYQSFLNSVDFPIQIVVQSRKLDVDKYIETVQEISGTLKNPLLKEQSNEYCSYIEKLVEYADIMEKKFYVIVPYDPYRSRDIGTFKRFMNFISVGDSIDNIKRRHREFDDMNKKLTDRVNSVLTGLENCNLRVAQLNTANLIELFYQIYNPFTARNEKIESIDKIDFSDYQPAN